MSGSKRKRCPMCTLYHPNGRRAVCRFDSGPWPLQPLLDHLPPEESGRDIAERLQASSTQVNRWMEVGLSDEQADRLACRIGYHPANIWGFAWFDTALTVVDRQKLEDGGWRQAWLHAEASQATEVAA